MHSRFRNSSIDLAFLLALLLMLPTAAARAEPETTARAVDAEELNLIDQYGEPGGLATDRDDLQVAIVVSAKRLRRLKPWEQAIRAIDGEVPIVRSFGSGVATLELNEQRRDLDYELHVKNISGVTQAHIHYGLPGKNGGVVAFLYGLESASGLINGELARGTITEADLIGDFAGDFDGFVQALRDGQFYVNLHTADYALGELRGQIGARISGPE